MGARSALGCDVSRLARDASRTSLKVASCRSAVSASPTTATRSKYSPRREWERLTLAQQDALIAEYERATARDKGAGSDAG